MRSYDDLTIEEKKEIEEAERICLDAHKGVFRAAIDRYSYPHHSPSNDVTERFQNDALVEGARNFVVSAERSLKELRLRLLGIK